MKTWYLTREGAEDLIHKGHKIPAGHKIFLSDAQAKLHQNKIIKTEPPDSPQEAIILNEYFEHLQFIKAFSEKTKTETPTTAEVVEHEEREP